MFILSLILTLINIYFLIYFVVLGLGFFTEKVQVPIINWASNHLKLPYRYSITREIGTSEDVGTTQTPNKNNESSDSDTETENEEEVDQNNDDNNKTNTLNENTDTESEDEKDQPTVADIVSSLHKRKPKILVDESLD